MPEPGGIYALNIRAWKGRDQTRQSRGANARASVLTEEMVTEIKRRIAAGERYSDIAKDFPVSDRQVGRIARGEAWSHVTIE